MTSKPVAGLDTVLTLAELPSSDTRRWSARRKGAIVAAVQAGLLSPEKASSIYGLSMDEFLSWQDAVAQHGLAGLRARRPRQTDSRDTRLKVVLIGEIERLCSMAHLMGVADIAAILERAASEARMQRVKNEDERCRRWAQAAFS